MIGYVGSDNTVLHLPTTEYYPTTFVSRLLESYANSLDNWPDGERVENGVGSTDVCKRPHTAAP